MTRYRLPRKFAETTKALTASIQKRGNPEEQLHRSIVAHLRTRGAKHMVFWHTTNNPRSRIAGARAKAMGMLKGVPDLTIITPDQQICFMEIKAPKGYLTPEQKDFRLRVEALGCVFAVVKDIDHATNLLESWGAITPVRAHAA